VWSKEPPFTNRMVVTRPVSAGEELTTTYLRPSTCSLVRRRSLKEGWYFDCVCPRCQDPTELGSHTNTLLCPACKTGFLLPVSPLDLESLWTCADCQQRESSASVTSLVESWLQQVTQMSEQDRYNVPRWLELHQGARELFHPGHEVMCEVAKWAVPVMARGPGQGLADFPMSLVQTKIELGEAYIRVLNVVEGVVSKNRAKTMYEVCSSKLFVCSLQLKEGKIQLRECTQMLKGFLSQMEDILSVMGVFGTNSSYEETVLHSVHSIRNQCIQYLSLHHDQ